MLRTKHKYIDLLKVKTTDEYLILGTIHPHNDSMLDFFYGHTCELWSILTKAFPEINLYNSLNEFSKDRIIKLLDCGNIWVSDIIAECSRKDSSAKDTQLYDLVYSKELIEQSIRKSQIHTIFFTSAFSKNNAAKLFTDLFQIDYKKSYDHNLKEFVIDKDLFGREIKGVVLFSPSGQANIGISKSKQFLSEKEKYMMESKPVEKFKIDFYRRKFSFLNDVKI